MRKLFFVIILLISVSFYWVWRTEIAAPLPVIQSKIFTITPGMSLNRIANELKVQGFIRHPKIFSLWVRINGKAQRVQAGEYVISPDLTLASLVEQFVQGKVKQHSFTLIDGWTFYQVMQALNNTPHLRHELSGLTPGAVMIKLALAGQYPEGWFYPETYYFAHGDSDLQILARAYQAMKKRLTQEWNQRAANLPYKDEYSALIVASLVEKESGVPAERPLIADILMRRWQKRMRLQVDPTVIYGLGPTFKGPLSKRDLRSPSRYNTYRRRGLPPTPIAMPSGNAIHAALQPQKNPYWYFVASGQGGHQFSTTLAEHNRAVTQYRRWKRHEQTQ